LYYQCTSCQKIIHNPPSPVWLCGCGKPLSVHYKWEGVPRDIQIETEKENLWRYTSVLPSKSTKEKISLGEGWTPLLPIDNNVYVKDETVNPTGSFKDRGMAMAVTLAKAQNVKKICLPSAGNAGVSASAYCQAAGIDCFVFLPETIPGSFKKETERYKSKLVLSGKTISEAAQTMINQKDEDWFDISTLKEPFRVEGKKTLGYEIVEQLGWSLPDVIIYPTGGGTGLIGMWKAFKEMLGMGWISGPLPRMVVAQSDGCAPVVEAFQAQQDATSFWHKSNTIALGLNVPGPLGGYWILEILSESNGIAVAAKESSLEIKTENFRERTGIDASAEIGVVWSAYEELREKKWITTGEKVVLFATGIERR
jgi:threonine synthase